MDAGKPAAGVAAVEIALDHLLDDGPEEAVLFLVTLLILGQEPVKIVKEHPVEDGAFRMSGAENSCHSKESQIKKRANPLWERIIADKTEVSAKASADSEPEPSTSFDAQNRQNCAFFR